jgi:hypothetical protein
MDTRWMCKFRFWRMEEPSHPTWDHNPERAFEAPVDTGAPDRASPNFMGLASLGLDIDIFFYFRYSVLLLSLILGLALSRPQVDTPFVDELRITPAQKSVFNWMTGHAAPEDTEPQAPESTVELMDRLCWFSDEWSVELSGPRGGV